MNLVTSPVGRAVLPSPDRGGAMLRKSPKIPAAKPIFNPKTFLAKVGQGRTHTNHGKNQQIFSQGDEAQAIYYIQKGKVKLTVVSKLGREVVIAILGA